MLNIEACHIMRQYNLAWLSLNHKPDLREQRRLTANGNCSNHYAWSQWTLLMTTLDTREMTQVDHVSWLSDHSPLLMEIAANSLTKEILVYSASE